MRVTFNAINRNIQGVLVNRYSELSKLQEQLSTGKRLLRPSDNPIDVANDLKILSKLKQLEQYNKNMDDGKGFMEVTDTALVSMDDILQRVREMAVKASSDTLSDKERLFINSEIEQLTRQVVALLNSEFKGEYIFAGTQTKIEPFPLDRSTATAQSYTDLDMAYYDGTSAPIGSPVQIRDAFTDEAITNIIPGSFKLIVAGTQYVEGRDYTMNYADGTITILAGGTSPATLAVDVSLPANYQITQFQITFENISKGKDIYGDPIDNNDPIYRQIETGITSQINITAQDLLVDNSTNTNLLTVLLDFGQALLQNDKTTIRASIQKIDISMKTLLSAQTTNGARVNRFESTMERNELQNLENARLQSELEDADLGETATKFSTAQTVYEAALRSAGKIMQQTLANYI